ncbi:Vancomycin resistance protein YoaR, contains peptidoglycan-binding and VanW domains [Lachnospiraceae bacterium]|nr:Vancomycin resistance protein YoaR, contains peptidoglycan-binding and VanW domains [Lachnospiraceae bacterium]
MKKLMMILVAVLAAVGVFFALPAFGAEGKGANAVIHEGVYAGDINLSGMTAAQAEKAIESYVDEMKCAQLTLNCVSGNSVTISGNSLGISWDNQDIVKEAVALGKSGSLIKRFKELSDLKKQNKVYDVAISVDDAAVKSILTEDCAKYDVEAVDATLEPNNSGSFIIHEGRDGQELNVEASAKAITDYLKNSFDGSDATIDLVVDTKKPKGDSETLSKITDVLGTFTTKYATSGADRSANIATGCKHVNGTLLYPGEQFSVYEAVSPFTEENGYHLAGSYLNGIVVESLGGGICQVSSTLYQAVLRAELQVDQRSNHSMVVDYVPHSGDAAIAGTAKDFKFTNNTDNPIYIAGSTGGKTITFTIYGVETRPAGRTIEFESTDLSTTEPVGDKIIADAGSPAGYVHTQSAHIGYVSEYWKIVKENGVEVSREKVNSSTYQAVPRTITIGTATGNAVTKAALEGAVASGNGDYAKSVAASVALDGGAAALAEQQAQAALAAAGISPEDAAAQAAAAQAAAEAAAAQQNEGHSEGE